MAFAVSSLPPSARALFLQAQKAPPLWPAAIRESYRVGIKDLNELADIAFYIHHPERGGKRLSTGESKLIKEWKDYRSTIQPWVPGATKAPVKPAPAAPQAPTLAGLLREVDPWSSGGTLVKRMYVSLMKDFLLRGLEGGEVDDSYWRFSGFDGFGREYSCSSTHSVNSVGRDDRKQHALANFKRNAGGCTTVSEVGRQLFAVEAAVSCSTFVLVRWAHQGSATGDGSLRAYTEYQYLRELTALSRQPRPLSVYSCYKGVLAMTLGNAG